MQDDIYFNALNQISQIGAVRFKKLLSYFPDMETAWRAGVEELQKAGIEPNISEIISSTRPEINPEKEFEKLESAGITLITARSKQYPILLSRIHNPPAVLYVRGSADVLAHEYAVAVVGTRKVTPYGKQAATMISKELAAAGVAVVSGLAYGVDELAHRAALDAHGTIIAVLGSGIDAASIYPQTNRKLADQIIDSGGVLISELPIGSLPLKFHFPYRNRIIAGLSLGVVVIEADLKSGSLITARAALDENRQVFAVPGSIFNHMSVGPNNLLKMGAQAITSASDVLDALNLQSVTKEKEARKIIPASAAESKLLVLLSDEPMHINQLIKESGLQASDVSSTLTMMEIKGIVKNLGALQYVRAR